MQEQIEKGKKAWYLDSQFDTSLGIYREVTINRWKVYKDFVKKFLSLKEIIKVLDAGCGDGVNILGMQGILESLSRRYKFYGIDNNPYRVKRVKERFFSSVSIVEGDICSLPFKDEAFDLILFNHVLEHIKSDKIALREIYRVLNRDGLLILGVPNEGCLLGWLRNNVFQRSILRTTDHVNFYNLKRLKTILIDTGFKFLEVRREGFFFPHLRFNTFLLKIRWGLRIIRFLSSTFPSQCAGFIVALKKGG